MPEHHAAARAVAVALKAEVPDTPGYADTRGQYEESLFDAFIGYASAGGADARRYRNQAGRAVIEAVSSAFYRGYQDAGGEETADDDERWLTGVQKEQLDFLGGVFAWLKEQRGAETITEDAVRGRVEAWAQALDGIYSEGVLRGKKNQMLTWKYGDTEHCETCNRLNGQRHSARWYLARDYIPGKAGAAMDCGGYRCQCVLLDKDGQEVTL